MRTSIAAVTALAGSLLLTPLMLGQLWQTCLTLTAATTISAMGSS